MFTKEEISAEKDLFAHFAGKTVLVCGACGLIGSTLTEYILEANDVLGINVCVIASARRLEKLKNRYKKYEGRADLILCEADVTDEEALFSTEHKIDYIVDCASPAHPVAYANTPVDVLMTNFIGTLNLLKLATAKDARLLYVSSSEVYGQPKGEVPADFSNAENDYGYIDVLAKRSCYPEGKRAAENLCIAYSSQYGCDVVISRMCQIFGASVTDDNSRADAQFLRNCIAGENIVLKSPATQLRSMCYVKDAASALLYILAFGESQNAYNVSDKSSTATIRELAEFMAKAAGVCVVHEYDETTASYKFITRAVTDSSKLAALGWKAKYTIEDGVKDMIETR